MSSSPLAVAARLAFNIARPHRSRPYAAQPFHGRNGLLLALAQPIDQHMRTEFLTAVAQELEANGQASAVGIGSVHGVARGSAALF
jgi:hypothetical protein